MNIQSIKTTSPIFFRGYTKTTNRTMGQNKMNSCISENYLMRDVDSVSFAVESLKKAVPDGCQIAVYGCSQNEGYTWATLLHDVNQDKRYKVKAYDIVPEVIQDAKIGVINIDNSVWGLFCDQDESSLLKRDILLTPQQRKIKQLFSQCFCQVPTSWQKVDIKNPNYTTDVTRLVTEWQDRDLALKRLEYLHVPDARSIRSGVDFIPREGVFNEVLDFQVADIFNIDRNLESGKTQVVSFKNSLYHILGSRKYSYENIDISPAQELFKKINSVLKDGGLFVLGCLEHDHFYDETLISPQCSLLYQDGKQIRVFNSSPVHMALKEAGFEPAYYSRIRENGLVSEIILTHLPSVWRKVRHV